MKFHHYFTKIEIVLLFVVMFLFISFIGYLGVKTYFTERQLTQLECRLDVKLYEDKRNFIQKRIWNLEDRLSENPKMRDDKIQRIVKELRVLKVELDIIDRERESTYGVVSR